jgi:hypothetical protein
MTQPMSLTRMDEQTARLKSRVERLQRFLEASDDARATEPPVRRQLSPPRIEAKLSSPNANVDRWQHRYLEPNEKRPLMPFPGYLNATATIAMDSCIGINTLGGVREVWQSVLGELQAKLARDKTYTYVVITGEPDFSYFIERGITFEYVSYLDRLSEPAWRRYFESNMALIKKKYGLDGLINVGDPRFAF